MTITTTTDRPEPSRDEVSAVAALGEDYRRLRAEIGKVITAAYFNAFVDLVGYMQRGAPTGAQASANAGIQGYSVKQSLVLRRMASRTRRISPPTSLSFPVISTSSGVPR